MPSTQTHSRSSKSLSSDFFERATARVARELLGKVLVHDSSEGRVAGRIVEVEAYLGRDDPASHAYRGPTKRAAIMYGARGIVYVYVSYGMHHCMNIVANAGREGQAGAVLIRALEPLEGLELMAKRRGTENPRLLCSGPGRLAQALGVDLRHNGAELGRSRLSVHEGAPPQRVGVSERIGISKGRGEKLRFFEVGSPHLSR